MKWFRSNIRYGSRLALFALAIQFLLSFGHFHGSAQAAPALVDANQPGHHDTDSFAAAHLAAWDRASHEHAFPSVGLRTSSDHQPDRHPTHPTPTAAILPLTNAPA